MPDFFIVGVPKRGTTALAGDLGAHPEIFMAAVKEPNHFWQLDVIVFDDLCSNPSAVYRDTLCFLGVAQGKRNTFPIADGVREVEDRACLTERPRRTSDETPT